MGKRREVPVTERREAVLSFFSTVRQMARNCQVCSVISCPGCST